MKNLICLLFVLCLGCGDSDVLSSVGEGCSDKADCESGLTCEGLVCEVDTSFRGWWMDPTSNLKWQTPVFDKQYMQYTEAYNYCFRLNLGGEQWRLPTIKELRSLIRGCSAMELGWGCNIEEGSCLSQSCQNDSCNLCAEDEGPINGCYWPAQVRGTCDSYWSSSFVDEGSKGRIFWQLNFRNSDLSIKSDMWNNEQYGYVRCVR